MAMKTDEQLGHEHLIASRLEDVARKIEEAMTSYVDEMHKQYMQTWSDIQEELSADGVTILKVPQATSNLEKITQINGFSSQPFMRFTINDKRWWMAGNGLQQLPGIWYLSSGQPRYIEGGTVTNSVFTPVAGSLYLGLFGKEVPYGRMSF